MKTAWRPGRNVIALSLVSFLTDASSEIIAPLLPLFLIGSLGASVAFVGVIEGAAESVASLLKLASGWWSDRVQRRKPLIVAGYTIASIMRPLMAIASSSGQVLAIRVADRVGKGIRGAPRDALLAASTPVEFRGRAFGLHRASDHAGAVVGPLIALLCLRLLGMPLRHVFWVAAIPGALSVLVAVIGVREQSAEQGDTRAAPTNVSLNTDSAIAPTVFTDVPSVATSLPTQIETSRNKSSSTLATKSNTIAEPLGVPFRRAMMAIVLFTLGNSTDAFLILRANQLGVAVAAIPLLWLVLHVVKMVSSTPGGALSDRIGRRPLIVCGWLLYALVYVGFAVAKLQWHVWLLFAVYGVVFGLTEGSEKALVADLVPAHRRGAAFGWYNAAIGIAALPASVVFGVVWDRYGAPVAFGMGSAIGLAAALLFAVTVTTRHQRA